MFKAPVLKANFGSEHVNGTENLLKLSQQNFWSIFSSFWDKLSMKTSLLSRYESM